MAVGVIVVLFVLLRSARTVHVFVHGCTLSTNSSQTRRSEYERKASFISMTMIHVRPVSDIRRNSSQFLMDDKGLLATDVKTKGYSRLQHHRWYSRTKMIFPAFIFHCCRDGADDSLICFFYSF